jgi:hypothetical protein
VNFSAYPQQDGLCAEGPGIQALRPVQNSRTLADFSVPILTMEDSCAVKSKP